MTFTPNPGQGALFKNKRATSEKHPAYQGYVVAHRNVRVGEKLELAAWLKDGQKGKFLSLKLSDPYKPYKPSAAAAAVAAADEMLFDDSIPF